MVRHDYGKRLSRRAPWRTAGGRGQRRPRELQESPGRRAQDALGPAKRGSRGGTFHRSEVHPARFHRGGVRAVQAGGWKRMLLCLFAPRLWRENRGSDEGMVKREWRRGRDGFDGMGFAFSRFASPRAALNPNLIGPIKEAQTISSKQN